MTKAFLKVEGIVLKNLRYGDYHQIMTLFTSEGGLLKFFLKGYSSKAKNFQQQLSPLSLVEIIYEEGERELLKAKEVSVKSSHLQLRENWHSLEAACELLQAIELSQFPEKEAPALYALFLFFLKKLTLGQATPSLVSSFYLKLLLHDGLLTIPFLCSNCGEAILGDDPNNHPITGCSHHAIEGVFWSQDELDKIYRLIVAQQYQEILNVSVDDELKKKIRSFFERMIEQL